MTKGIGAELKERFVMRFVAIAPDRRDARGWTFAPEVMQVQVRDRVMSELVLPWPQPAPRFIDVERTVRVEKTGEFTTFTEKLPAYENYVPDLQRSDVDARTRGLSHLCVVLFNLNEFAYLD